MQAAIAHKNQGYRRHAPGGSVCVLSFASILLLVAPACLKGPGFLTQGTNDGATLVATTNVDGDVTGNILGAYNSSQQVLAAAGSGVDGASVMFPPGALSIDLSVTVGLGGDAAAADVLAAIGLSSQSVDAVGNSLYVGTSENYDLQAPMTLSIPIGGGGAGLRGLSLDDDNLSQYAVTFIGEKKTTGETFAGFIPNEELAIKDGIVSFETELWGSYSLIKFRVIAETDVRPTGNIRVPVPNIAPILHNQVKGNPKMAITGRTPFVVREGGELTITGENLDDVTAKIGTLSLSSEIDSSGNQLTITIPGKSVLKRYGVFIIALRKAMSNAEEVNFVLTENDFDDPVIVAAASRRNKVCTRQKFFDVLGNEIIGTGTDNCVGPDEVLYDCSTGTRTGCKVSGSDQFAMDMKDVVNATNVSGGPTGTFVSRNRFATEGTMLKDIFTMRTWHSPSNNTCNANYFPATLADLKLAYFLGAADGTNSWTGTNNNGPLPIGALFQIKDFTGKNFSWIPEDQFEIKDSTGSHLMCVSSYQGVGGE